MNTDSQKVTAGHLARKAFLYVHQSTLRQVMENTESTRRQYDLQSRAQALGWPPGRITVIDSDLGQSGADRDRDGFNRLVAEVTLGNAGIVLSLEVSRLARNSSDWHRLLELCAMTGTLILDEDGLYDPHNFNDRLVLGLKGQISEAELHFLRARLQGGIISRARRGELKLPLPIGFVYDPLGKVALDPDSPSAKQRFAAVHHLRANRIGNGNSQGLPQGATAVSPPPMLRPAYQRSGLEQTDSFKGTPDPSQSPLCRRLHIRPHSP